MNDNQKMIEVLLEPYPHNMQTKDIAEFLNISVSTVYNLIKQEGFPSIHMPGSRIYLVPKHEFIPWYLRQISKETAQETNN